MIGHLQRNKVRRTLPLVEMIHSADSPRLIEAVDRIAGELSTDAAVAYLDGLIYVGPASKARMLPGISAMRRRNVSRAPADIGRRLRVERRVEWPRLTEPRAFLSELCRARGVDVDGLDHIPHDLWAAGQLPANLQRRGRRRPVHGRGCRRGRYPDDIG